MVSFKRGTKARRKRGQIAAALVREKAPVREPYAVATTTVKRMRLHPKCLDPWDSPVYTRRFPAYVEVLYLRKEDVDPRSSDFKKYWKHTDRLIEVAVHVSGERWDTLKKFIGSWKHRGGSWYMSGGFAVRCGGANQHKDPLNVFFLEG